MTACTCPTCGAEWQAPPITVDLSQNTAYFFGRAVKLEPMEAEILFAIVRSLPHPCATERIAAALYGHGDWPSTWLKSLHVRMVRLRKKITAEGYEIKAVRDCGYILVHASAAQRVVSLSALRAASPH